MTAMQMVLGLEQLDEFSEQLQKRCEIALRIREVIDMHPELSIESQTDNLHPCWYRIYFSIQNNAPSYHQRTIFYSKVKAKMIQHGIPLANVSCEDISKEPMFKQYRKPEKDLLMAKN